MNTNDMQYQDISAQMQGLGTAPALMSTELEERIPFAENPLDVNRELTRWLFFAGDVLVPSQKRERADLRTGGEYMGQMYKTLVRSKGLIRRCQITPLEIGYDFMSDEMIGDDANLHVVTTVEHNTPGRGTLQASPGGRLNGLRVYPGDEIKGILQGERNATSKGIVELNQLAGVEYAEFKKSGLQEFIFPEWAKVTAGIASLPVKVSELEAHLNERKAATTEADIKSLIEGTLASCEQYRVWGMNYLKFASQLVRLPAHQGFVHTYSELAEQLFTQLEVRREDLISTDRDMAEIIAKASAGNNISNPEMNALLAKMTDVMSHLAQQAGPTVAGVTTEPTLSIGDAVTVADGRNGTVQAKPFGRLKIAFEDGTTEMFDRDQVV
jgi:hypothetical protein